MGATNSIPPTLLPSGSLTNSLATPHLGGVAESLGRMMGALALVFAVLVGVLWVYRRWQHLLQQRTPASGLRVVEAKSLGQRLAVYVVAYRHQRFLVGGSPAGLTLLSPLDPDPEALETDSPNPPPTPVVTATSGGSFQSILEKVRTPWA